MSDSGAADQAAIAQHCELAADGAKCDVQHGREVAGRREVVEFAQNETPAPADKAVHGVIVGQRR